MSPGRTLAGTADAAAGRFAPSPSGPLHLGSLLAAVASYLDARSQGLRWQVRLDDLDAPRNEAGAEAAILTALEAHGLYWDGPVVRQSERTERYRAALAELAGQGSLFYCRCPRRALRGLPRYPGTCRSRVTPLSDAAVRVRIDDAAPGESLVAFDDLVLGPQRCDLQQRPGDFIVKRRDGLFAYHLATAVDDGAPGIVRVIRGRDLLPSTAPQIFLMRRLGLAVPRYGHILLLLGDSGRKLSKQNRAEPLDLAQARTNLSRVLGALQVPVDDPTAPCPGMLAAAARHFSLAALPRRDVPVAASS